LSQVPAVWYVLNAVPLNWYVLVTPMKASIWRISLRQCEPGAQVEGLLDGLAGQVEEHHLLGDLGRQGVLDGPRLGDPPLADLDPLGRHARLPLLGVVPDPAGCR
jgi:hypothetical protein